MKTLTACFALLFAAGCTGGSNNAADAGAEDPDVEGCEHLKEGPAVALVASTDGGVGPALRSDHQRYDVTLGATDGGFMGQVTFAPSAAGDYVFFLGSNTPLAVSNAQGAVAFESSGTSSPVCTEVKGRHLAPLAVSTYTLRLGPATTAAVSVVVEPAAHGHD